MAGLSGPDSEHAAPEAALRREHGERGSTLRRAARGDRDHGHRGRAILLGSSTTFTAPARIASRRPPGSSPRNYAEALDLAVPSGGGVVQLPDPYAVPLTFTRRHGLSGRNVPGHLSGSDPTVPQYQTVTITVRALNGGSRDVDRRSCVQP